MILVCLWKGFNVGTMANAVGAVGHASAVVLVPQKGTKPMQRAVMTWFPDQPDNSGSSGGSSGSTASGTSRFPATPLQEWSPTYMGFRDGSTLRTENNKGYYSWMKSDSAKQWMGMFDSDPQKTTDILNDLMHNSFRPPSHVLEVQSLSDPGAYTGLSDANMLDWWATYSQNTSGYKFFKRNCSTVTALALMAGGAGGFAKSPKLSALFWSPGLVYDWAEEVKKAIKREQDKFESAHNEMRVQAAKVVNPGDVMTLAGWKEESKIKQWYRMDNRYQLLLDVDARLKDYEDVEKRNDLDENFRDESRIQALAEIIRLLAQILKERPKTERREAIVKLAAQCLKKEPEIRDTLNERMHRQAQEQQRIQEAEREKREKRSREQFRLMMRLNKAMQSKDPVQIKQAAEEFRNLQKETGGGGGENVLNLDN